MNANPTFAAPVAPALDAHAVRAPERTRSQVATLETFDVYCVSLDACRQSASLVPTLSATLRDQLVRASSSVVLVLFARREAPSL